MVFEKITDGWTGLEKPKNNLYQNVQNVWSDLMLDKNASTHISKLELVRILLIKNMRNFLLSVHLLNISKCHLWIIRLSSKLNPSQLLNFHPFQCFPCFHNIKLPVILIVLIIYVFRLSYWETLCMLLKQFSLKKCREGSSTDPFTFFSVRTSFPMENPVSSNSQFLQKKLFSHWKAEPSKHSVFWFWNTAIMLCENCIHLPFFCSPLWLLAYIFQDVAQTLGRQFITYVLVKNIVGCKAWPWN